MAENKGMFESAKTGDKVLFYRQRAETVEATITKVGRKYLEIDAWKWKFRKIDGGVDDYYGCYVITPEADHARKVSSEMVKNLRDKGVEIVHNPSIERVRMIYNALRVCLDLPDLP